MRQKYGAEAGLREGRLARARCNQSVMPFARLALRILNPPTGLVSPIYSRSLATAQTSRPPPRSLVSLDTLYPFLLLSAITSLALNLGHSRSAVTNEADHLRAQISVLESILAEEREHRPLSGDEHELIERQLELVGLGRGKGKAEHIVKGRFGQTAWGEVFFGKKGREWEENKAAEEAEWEKS